MSVTIPALFQLLAGLFVVDAEHLAYERLNEICPADASDRCSCVSTEIFGLLAAQGLSDKLFK